ncbi:hypothetical protein K457DRAFT_15260 [Linnemannia elongata AG-77]|uniref:Uncharacterized protein n=1 Tax=Linnemannia elongata AG-77 TaxID=1314771 RepID=A0A197KA56_9FUNG|nr:hypothetical protein K457DRAFT_15260 [Linnemannia elongata AG-77]
MPAYPTPSSPIINLQSLSVMSKTAYNYPRRSDDTVVVDEAPALPDLEDDIPTNENDSPDDDEDDVADEPMEDQSVPNLIVVQSPSPGSPTNTSYDIHPAVRPHRVLSSDRVFLNLQ